MARPCKLTPKVQECIADAARGGAHRSIAATLAGIGERTLYRWLAAGEEGKRNGKFRQLWQAVKKAEAEWEQEQAEAIRETAAGGQLLSRTTTERKDGSTILTETYTRPEWTARAWLLERKAYERWGRRERLELTGDEAKPVTFKYARSEEKKE